MPKANDNVAAAFYELADLLEISGGERFKILAYRRAAAEIEALAKDVSSLSLEDLSALKGIGKATASKIREMVASGRMSKLEEVRASVPAGLREMTALPGLGPKKALLLNRELGIATLEQLRAAIGTQSLRALKGFGPKTEANLLRALDRYATSQKRIGLEDALQIAERMLTELRRARAVRRADYAGSLRRMKETIGDIDILASSYSPDKVMRLFSELSTSGGHFAKGTTKSSVLTPEGVQIDLRVVAPDEYGAALQYFTGSQAHNVRVREIAVKKGMKLSEYGLFTVDGNERVAAATEEEVYAALGMSTPPPTMRENRGEVELALKGELPTLIDVSDLKGDLHSHTTYSDGLSSVEEMSRAAAALDYQFLAITDHAGPGWRMSEESRARQAEEIAAARAKHSIRILHGVEVSVSAEGDLSIDDELLGKFDLVIASVHDHFQMAPKELTRRIFRALSNPRVNILAHPTGRRIGKRDPMEFDLEAVFAEAALRGIAVEINSTPARLDLKDDHIRLARECGCKFALNTDSHAAGRLHRIRLGVGMAQRGWLEAGDVINTYEFEQLRPFLDKG